jgi:AraC family transcriptional regulator
MLKAKSPGGEGHALLPPLEAESGLGGTATGACRGDTLAAHRRAVERVITAARDRLCEPLSLNDMARIAYVSPFHFNRVFRQITGLPPSKFVGSMRLEMAKRMLLTTTRSVTDICYDVGYNSPGTFTTRFTRHIGLGPRQLRRFAERLTPASVVALCAQFAESSGGGARGPRVTGLVTCREPSGGIIFVGLFKDHVPLCRPVGGTLLTAPGPFRIGPVPDGAYHLLGAALPPSEDTIGYLLPDRSRMLVGVGSGPVCVRGGQADAPARLILRPMQLTDPPLLISLPFLLSDARRVARP